MDAPVYIVIAAYNEGRAIGDVVVELRAQYANVIVVDDGSMDDTGDRAVEAGAVVLTHALNRGQGAALQTGITYALKEGAEVIVTFDADGQHQVSDIEALTAPILNKEVDICLGSRFLEHAHAVPLSRRVLLRMAVLFTWLSSGLKLSDAHNGLRAFSRRAAQKIDMKLDRMAHASEIVDQIRQVDLPYKEIPVHIRYTEYSRAKGQGAKQALRIAFDYYIGRFIR